MSLKINTSRLDKSLRREHKHNKRKHGHRRDGDSVKLIVKIQSKKRDDALKRKRKAKEEFLESDE